jgi:hypothetical protein
MEQASVTELEAELARATAEVARLRGLAAARLRKMNAVLDVLEDAKDGASAAEAYSAGDSVVAYATRRLAKAVHRALATQ